MGLSILAKNQDIMGFKPSNLASKKFVFKFVELALLFVVFMLYRVGGKIADLEYTSLFPWGNGDVDIGIFGIMTSAGYLFSVIILIIGIVMGDNNHKFTLLLFNFFGFLFFIALGIEQIRVWIKFDSEYLSDDVKAVGYGMGATAILNSFVFLVDTVFSVVDLRKSE